MTLGPDQRTLASRLLARYHATGHLPAIAGGDHEGEGGDGSESNEGNQNDNANSGGEQGGGSGESSGFKPIASQAELDNIIGKRLDRERKKLAKEIRDEIEAEARTAEAERQGNFEKLYADLKAEHDAIKGEVESKDARIDELLTIVKADVDAKWDDLPEEVKDAYDGDADDPLAKRKHMQRMAKVIERLTAAGEHKPGNGPNPPPADNKRDLKAAEQQARRRYTV